MQTKSRHEEPKTRSPLAIARFERWCSLAELARLAGVATSTLSRVERGERNPSPKLARWLEAYFSRPLFMPDDVR